MEHSAADVKFTKDDSRSLREMLDEYDRLDERFQKSGYDWEQVRDNYSGLAPEEQQFIKEYSRYMDFFDDMRDALDFTKTSTFVQQKFDEKVGLRTEIDSLMANVDDYAYIMVTLTGGFNDGIEDLLEWTRTKIRPLKYMTFEAYTEKIKMPLSCISVNLAIAKCMGNKDAMDTVTVSQVVKVVAYLLRQCMMLDISRDDIINDTVRAFRKADEEGRLTVFPGDEEYDWEEDDEEPDVITHTFEGHITPISKEDIAAVEEYERRERAMAQGRVISPENVTFTAAANNDRRDRQLEEKDRQIEELTAALKASQERQDRLMESMEKTQSMYAEMMDKQMKENGDNNNTEKKGFWGRLFGKK